MLQRPRAGRGCLRRWPATGPAPVAGWPDRRAACACCRSSSVAPSSSCWSRAWSAFSRSLAAVTCACACLDLGVLDAAGDRREFGLRGLQVVLDGDELALRLLLLRQELRALSVDATDSTSAFRRVSAAFTCASAVLNAACSWACWVGVPPRRSRSSCACAASTPRRRLTAALRGGLGGAARGAVGVDFRSRSGEAPARRAVSRSVRAPSVAPRPAGGGLWPAPPLLAPG